MILLTILRIKILLFFKKKIYFNIKKIIKSNEKNIGNTKKKTYSDFFLMICS